MSARTFERQHVVAAITYVNFVQRPFKYLKLDPFGGVPFLGGLRDATRWPRKKTCDVAVDLTATYRRPFVALPDRRLPRIVRGKGQRRNRRRA